MHKNNILNDQNILTKSMNNTDLKNSFLNDQFNLSSANELNSDMLVKHKNYPLHNNGLLGYYFNKQSNLGYKLSNKIVLSNNILEHIFQNSFISTPKFKLSNNKIIITLFYYSLSEKEITKLKANQNTSIGKTKGIRSSEIEINKEYNGKDKSSVNIAKLEKLFIDLFDINVEIRLIKLYYPFLNSKILAKFITAVNNGKFAANPAPVPLNKNILKSSVTKKQRMDKVDSLFKKINLIKSYNTSINPINNVTNIKSKVKDYPISDSKTIKSNLLNLTGVKYEISGRMTRRRTASRSSLLSKYKGTFNFNSTKSLIDHTKFSYKNKNGAFTVKVWLSSNSPSF